VNGPLPPFDHHAPRHRELWAAQTDAMRAEGPVGWTPANGGHWIIVGYEAVREAALNWEVFSCWHDPTGACPYAKGIGIPPFAFPLILSESDPPVSTERRMLEMPFFKPADIAAREPVVQRHADACLNGFAGRAEVDLFRDFAMPVVAKTTMEIVGVDLGRWTEFTVRSHHGAAGPSFDLAADIDRVHAMLLELVRERRRAPRGDIASALVAGVVAGEPVRDEEALSMLSALVLGGFDTTSSMITQALIWLDEHREAHARLLAEPALMANAADEFLRIATPSLGGARNLTRETIFHGHRMSRGDRVLLSWAAANRDPAVFEAPHDVRLGRPNAGKHLTFGIGPHRCLGADLARLMGRVAIRSLLARLPDYAIRRAGLAPYQSPGGFVLGWAAVPATPGRGR
jgi:cytochrome P450